MDRVVRLTVLTFLTQNNYIRFTSEKIQNNGRFRTTGIMSALLEKVI